MTRYLCVIHGFSSVKIGKSQQAILLSGAPEGKAAQTLLLFRRSTSLFHTGICDVMGGAFMKEGVDPASIDPSGGVAFTTTHWSVVLKAQGRSPAAEEALNNLCRTYWQPVHGFIRRQGISATEAEDLTQGFFALILERGDFDAVRREKGRLRSYLLTSLKHFLASQQRRAMAAKRGSGHRLVPLEELTEDKRIDLHSINHLGADRIYERGWALALMEQVLRRLKNEYDAAGNAALFALLKELLPDEPGAPSRAEIGAKLGMTENAVRQAFHRLRRRYQALLREEIASTVAIAGDIDDELRHLISVLRS